MQAFDDQQLTLARVYASAMLALAVERGQADEMVEGLEALVSLIDKDIDLRTYFTSPTVETARRRDMVEKLFRGRFSDLLVDSMQVLNAKGRLGLLPAVAQSFRELWEEEQGRVDVMVRSAAPVGAGLNERLRSLIRKRTGREPQLQHTVDESLIGGVVLQVGDEKLDASIARKLEKLTQELLNRASREIHDRRSYVEEGVT